MKQVSYIGHSQKNQHSYFQIAFQRGFFKNKKEPETNYQAKFFVELFYYQMVWIPPTFAKFSEI